MTRPLWRNRWWSPAICLFLGLVMLGAYAIGDRPEDGLKALAVMVVLGLVFLFGRRSETLQGIGGPGRDERWAAIDLRAGAAAGLVTIAVIVGGFLYEVADGRDGSPWAQLAAVAGVSYLVAVALLRARA